MKKCLSFVIALITVFSLLAIPSAFAQDAPITNEPQIIQYEDGSYLVISIETSYARVAGVTKTKYATYHGKDGTSEWKMELTGTFTYNGTTAICTASSCSVSIYDTDWYVISKTASKSKNVAYATAVLGRKVLGVKVDEKTYNLTLTCDANGNFS